MNNREFWSGNMIKSIKDNEVFVFGSNPEGIHGAGGAKTAINFGAMIGTGRGLMGNSYGLVTKSLNAGFTEKSTGITYHKSGYCSVSESQIINNIDELYSCAEKNPNKKFIISFQYETYENGVPKKSLNGYSSEEMFKMFVRESIPFNIIFHDSYKEKLEAIFNSNKSNDLLLPPKSNKYTFFFRLDSPFSNFHPSIIKYKDYTFISNEQFIMFAKAKTFKDEAAANKILEFNLNKISQDFINNKINAQCICSNTSLSKEWNKLMIEIKQAGRGVKNYNDDVWVKKREKVVYFGAKLKFTQNESLKFKLLETKDDVLVEASPYDKIWGIGLSEKDAQLKNESMWPGKNLLGLILTSLKTEFLLNEYKEIENLNFYNIGNKVPEDGFYIGRLNKK